MSFGNHILPLNEWGVFGKEKPSSALCSSVLPNAALPNAALPNAVLSNAVDNSLSEPLHNIIAGPCSAESRQQLLDTAVALHGSGIPVFRAGLWKPRTHPGTFEGVGVEGLPWLADVRRIVGMKVATEVATAAHVEACIEAGIDILWIGARTTANPFLMQEIAEALSGVDIPVLVKNPLNPDIGLWIGAIERLDNVGIHRLGVIHRGFSSSRAVQYRNDPCWHLAVGFRTRCPQIPFFVDPSHMGGDRKYIKEIMERALRLGADGFMIESHISPDHALSDSRQQLTPAELSSLLALLSSEFLESGAEDDTANLGTKLAMEEIRQLRERIDIIDEELLSLIAERMQISRGIGRCKAEHKMPILQTSRWDEVLSRVLSEGEKRDLPAGFLTTIFNAIHEESVRQQDDSGHIGCK